MSPSVIVPKKFLSLSKQINIFEADLLSLLIAVSIDCFFQLKYYHLVL